MCRLLFAAAFLFTGIAALAELPFTWEAKTEGSRLVISARVAPAHYFYADTLEFEVTGADGKSLAPASAPEPTSHNDDFFGETAVYPAGVWNWEFDGTPPYRASVSFQGCRAAEGDKPAMCFLPQTLALTGSETPVEKLAGRLEDAAVDNAGFRFERKAVGLLDVAGFARFLDGGDETTAGGTASPFADQAWFWIILFTLLGGLGLNLTPCVLPMIPVNLAIIGAAGEERFTGLRRGLAYGVGMAAAYGILGVAVILTGAQFGALNSSSWFNFTIATVFLVLALAMFGAFNIDFSGRIAVKPSRIPGGRTVVALIMGAVAALLAGACVAPVVISVLVFATERYQGGNWIALGLPFLLGLGMALPWPFAGAGIGVLPKPGRFMVAVKYIFGVVILVAALYYGWVGYTLLPGRFSPEVEIARLEEALATARAENKPVLIDFWATWCKNCRSMSENVLPAPEIRERLNRFVFVKFQAEELSAPGVAGLLRKYEIPGLPAFVILTPQP